MLTSWCLEHCTLKNTKIHGYLVLQSLLCTFRSFNVQRRSYEAKKGSVEVYHSIFSQWHVHGNKTLAKNDTINKLEQKTSKTFSSRLFSQTLRSRFPITRCAMFVWSKVHKLDLTCSCWRRILQLLERSRRSFWLHLVSHRACKTSWNSSQWTALDYSILFS